MGKLGVYQNEHSEDNCQLFHSQTNDRKLLRDANNKPDLIIAVTGSNLPATKSAKIDNGHDEWMVPVIMPNCNWSIEDITGTVGIQSSCFNH